MSAIDRGTVEKVAGLARIALTPGEVERFSAQLGVVLDAVDRLRAVDTSGVPATASILPVDDVTRPDAVVPSLPLEEVLRNAPQRDGDMFRVQTPLEER